MKKLTLKDISIIVLCVIAIYALKVIIPLLIILALYLFIKSKNKPKIEEKPQIRPIEEPFNVEAYKATLADCEELIRNDNLIRKETDLRQFKGRSDVTKEELATYMYEQRKWDGVYERHLQMEEIIKVCNLTNRDIEWVEEELTHYHPFNNCETTYDNKCCLVRSEEQKAICEYYNEKDRIEVYKRINDLKKWKQERQFDIYLKIDTFAPEAYERMVNTLARERKKQVLRAIDDLRRCDYEAWLKLKGYTNE